MLSTLNAARRNTDSKLLPRSIYDVLAQSSNDLQQLLCRIQCRQTLGIVASLQCEFLCKFKVSFLSETLSTLFTDKMSLSSVNPHVDFQVLFLN